MTPEESASSISVVFDIDFSPAFPVVHFIWSKSRNVPRGSELVTVIPSETFNARQKLRVFYFLTFSIKLT